MDATAQNLRIFSLVTPIGKNTAFLVENQYQLRLLLSKDFTMATICNLIAAWSFGLNLY
jgi:hypothetical protein